MVAYYTTVAIVLGLIALGFIVFVFRCYRDSNPRPPKENVTITEVNPEEASQTTSQQ